MQNIQTSIGNTPLLELSNITASCLANIFAKHEARNPAGSVKCRVAASLIETAQKNGSINKDSTIIEPTSGNTGIGLAFICARLSLRLILTMPDSMSIERRKLLSHLGAELVLTPAAKGMNGAIAKAKELCEELDNSYLPDQFSNYACVTAHINTTGPEILAQTAGNIDYFVAGVGTGGTISGVGKVLKEHNPEIKIIAVEPAKSPVISGGKPGPHGIQGIGAGFIPKNLNIDIIDEIIQVTDEDAIATSRQMAKEEGILCGISSGAAMWACLELGKREKSRGKNIVTVLPDSGERYISTALFIS
ncbi:MAG: cysteine synthase A [Desulfotalea sp.]